MEASLTGLFVELLVPSSLVEGFSRAYRARLEGRAASCVNTVNQTQSQSIIDIQGQTAALALLTTRATKEVI